MTRRTQRHKILAWFARQKKTYPVCPVNEIVKMLGHNSGTVDVAIQALFADRLLAWHPGGWRITPEGRAALAEMER